MSLTFCPGSPSTHHKLGALHFLDKERRQFTQSCRYCFGIRTGRFVLNDSDAPSVLHERFDYPESGQGRTNVA